MEKHLINLDKRKDKLETVTQELDRVGIKNWVRFPAVETPNGRDGCRMSHLSVLNMLKDEDMFLIMEDDVKFLHPISMLRKAIRQLPKDWDMLYGGATLTKDLERYSENLYRLKGGWCTHFLLFNNQHGIADYILNNSGDAFKVDVFYADVIQEEFNCYITYPMMVTQQEGYSDIIRKHQTYQVISDWYNKHIK